MMHTLKWVGTEVRKPPTFYGLNDLEEFLMKYEVKVMENHILPALDIALKSTPAIWWSTCKYQQLVPVQKVTTHQIQCRAGTQI
jgi:hypothetical protein